MQAPTRTSGWETGRAAGESLVFGAPEGPSLNGYLVRPNFSAASGSGRHGVVLVHGFPEPGQQAGSPSYGLPQLATRLAAETGASVLSFDLRGTGESSGDFSLSGWRADLAAAVTAVRSVPGIERVWLIGFAAGATLAICATAEDPAIAGVAALAPQSELVEHGGDPRRFLDQARASGIIRSAGFPPDQLAWLGELAELDVARCASEIPPRPLLIVHGAADDIVPMTDARGLADAASGSAELRILAGGGHMLLHDPRAIALLLGWFDRHLGAAV